MFKFHSIMEDIAEKVLGRLLPQVEAKAGGCTWVFAGCCGNGKKRSKEYCNGMFNGNTKCEGVCPY